MGATVTTGGAEATLTLGPVLVEGKEDWAVLGGVLGLASPGAAASASEPVGTKYLPL